MPAEGSDELLVTITPLLSAAAAARPKDRPWLGPLLIVGMPVALAVAVFMGISLI